MKGKTNEGDCWVLSCIVGLIVRPSVKMGNTGEQQVWRAGMGVGGARK